MRKLFERPRVQILNWMASITGGIIVVSFLAWGVSWLVVHIVHVRLFPMVGTERGALHFVRKVSFNSTFFEVPAFYEDKPFKCRDCGTKQIWTAKQQKWWYEDAGGDLETTAVQCRSCRDFKKSQKDLQKKFDEKSET